MATVYSLVCWGGSAGKSISGVVATDVCTLTNHGLRTGKGIVPQSTVSGVTSGTTYYVRVIDANTFTLHPTATDATNNTNITNITATTAFTCKSAYLLGLADTSRWGTRIFNGIKAWRDDRYTNALASNYEVGEVGENFIDYVTAALSMNIPCAGALYTSMVNGSRSAAWHGGSHDSGYTIMTTIQYSHGISFDGVRHEIEGLTLKSTTTNAVILSSYLGLFNTLRRCFVIGNSSSGQEGIRVLGTANQIIRCIVTGFAVYGLRFYGYENAGSTFANNIVAGNGVGFYTGGAADGGKGWFYNNISIGNTTNWSANAPSAMHGGRNNAGASTGGTPWGTSPVTTLVTTANTDFINVSANNFEPYSATSAQVNTGTSYYDFPSDDLKGNYSPDYESATYATTGNIPDIGAFEFVHAAPDGGRPPATVPLSITSMINGSEFAIYKTADMSEIAAPQATTGSYTANYTYTADTAIIVRVRKKGYLPYEYAGTITATGFALSVSQIIDPIAL